LPLKAGGKHAGRWLRIGALVRNTDLAYHPLVEERYPVLASAIMAGASQQLRNMASTGGNLLQRTAAITSTTSDALQQTRAGQRLLRHRRPQSHARDPRQQ
jgi:Aerobic-type carbon monoxide dehydrogenase, middle subunit CoxM/CutM homologs